MPNHVTNILTVIGDRDRRMELFEAIKREDIGIGSIDFAKIIPVPNNIYQGNLELRYREKYGKNNWLDWNTENWGSKWNSYGYDEMTKENFDGTNITFLTAWSNVSKVIEKLAEMYPDLEFTYQWADEDLGHNVGMLEYQNGKEIGCFIPSNGSEEAMEMAAQIHQIDLEDEEYDTHDDIAEMEHT